MNVQKMNKFNKINPLFAGLSGDLLFWIAIDTLFLTIVKKFTVLQIVSMTSISMMICILLQIPLFNIIKTFGKNVLEVALTFLNMINAILKNNLELQNRGNEYIKFRTNANTIYALVTMLILFIASIMFNINNYLPMIGCILFCFICSILSLNMIDYSNNDC